MTVVRIRHMMMCMHHGLMHVGMAMRTDRHRMVHMVVMAVIMAVSVLVFQPLMHVLMPMRLRQVQHHAQHHQQAAHRHDPGAAAVTQGDSNCCAHERGVVALSAP